jgi:hypothetical protein
MGLFQTKLLEKYHDKNNPREYEINSAQIMNYSRFLDKLIFVYTFDSEDELKKNFTANDPLFKRPLTNAFDVIVSEYNPEIKCNRFAIVSRGTKFIDYLVSFSIKPPIKANLFNWQTLQDFVFIYPDKPRPIMSDNDIWMYRQKILRDSENKFKIYEYKLDNDYKCLNNVNVSNDNLKKAINAVVNTMVNSTLDKDYSQLTYDEINKHFTTLDSDGVFNLKYNAYPIAVCPNKNGMCIYTPATKIALDKYRNMRIKKPEEGITPEKTEELIIKEYQEFAIPLNDIENQLNNSRSTPPERTNVIYYTDYKNSPLGSLENKFNKDCVYTDKVCSNENDLQKIQNSDINTIMEIFEHTTIYISHKISEILLTFAKGNIAEYITNLAKHIRELGTIMDLLEYNQANIIEPIEENLNNIKEAIKTQGFNYENNALNIIKEYEKILPAEKKDEREFSELIKLRVSKFNELIISISHILKSYKNM